MAIGVKVDPRIIAAGTVIAIEERRGWVNPRERMQGVVGDIDRHDVLLSQGDGGWLAVRYRVRDGLALPKVGDFVAVDARVSEGSMVRDGSEVSFVSLVAVAEAHGALDLIASKLRAGQKAA